MAPRRLTPAECSVHGCDRVADAKGLCKMHYKRAWRGLPLVDDRPEVGSLSGRGRSGIMEHSADGQSVMCHECGGWFQSVGAHLRRGHDGMTAREYRRAHGIPAGVPLVSRAMSEAMSAESSHRVGGAAWARLEAARDPAAASASRTRDDLRSARVVSDGKASRARVGRRRGEHLRTCKACGVQWCALPGGYQNVTCSPQCVAALITPTQIQRRS